MNRLSQHINLCISDIGSIFVCVCIWEAGDGGGVGVGVMLGWGWGLGLGWEVSGGVAESYKSIVLVHSIKSPDF